MSMGSIGGQLQRGQVGTSTDLNLAKEKGREWTHKDLDFSKSVATLRSSREVTVRLVQNTSGVAILPKYAVQLNGAKDEIIGYVTDGGSATGATQGYPVDEFIPATGIADDGYGYVVVAGPAMCVVSLIAAEAVIAAGAEVIAATAAASTTSTTAGKVTDMAGATSVLALNRQHRIGTAISGTTTADTGGDVLVNVGKL